MTREWDNPYYLGSCTMRQVDFLRMSDEFGRRICGTVSHSNDQYSHVLEIFGSMFLLERLQNLRAQYQKPFKCLNMKDFAFELLHSFKFGCHSLEDQPTAKNNSVEVVCMFTVRTADTDLPFGVIFISLDPSDRCVEVYISVQIKMSSTRLDIFTCLQGCQMRWGICRLCSVRPLKTDEPNSPLGTGKSVKAFQIDQNLHFTVLGRILTPNLLTFDKVALKLTGIKLRNVW